MSAPPVTRLKRLYLLLLLTVISITAASGLAPEQSSKKITPSVEVHDHEGALSFLMVLYPVVFHNNPSITALPHKPTKYSSPVFKARKETRPDRAGRRSEGLVMLHLVYLYPYVKVSMFVE